MQSKTIIRGIPIANVTMDEAVDAAKSYIDSDRALPARIFTPNAEILQCCIEDRDVFSIITAAEMCIPDGSGVLLAAKILGTPLKQKVAGVEFGERLFALSKENGYRVFLLGAKPGISEAAAERMGEKYPGLCICGTNDGYFQKSGKENDAVLEKIKASKADILFVCLGAPAQEKWISDNLSSLGKVKLCVGLGGSLDVYAGNVKRAPKIFIKLHCEWLHRLLKQPSRLWRMMKLPKWVLGTVKYKFRKKL